MTVRFPRVVSLLTVSAVGLMLAACGGKGGSSSNVNSDPPAGSITQVNHIIFMLQENRGFDHYFGHLPQYRASQGLPASDVDGEPATASNPAFTDGHPIAAFKMVSTCQEDLSPFWNESHVAFNLKDPTSTTATLDGFANAAGGFASSTGEMDVAGARVMGYYDQDILPYYYFMATQFATSDRWFAPVDSRTQTNRAYAMAATSHGQVYPPLAWSGQTIFDLLQNANVSWKVYQTGGSNSLGLFPIAVKHPEKLVTLNDYFNDVKNGTLPQVAFIDNGVSNDEHPNEAVDVGSAFAASIINPLMGSSSWKDSVFILTWDEGGGFYDHVPPITNAVNPDGLPVSDLQAGDISGPDTGANSFTRTGYRVPLIVISPFTKKNFVSHTPMDYTAILKFIETRFSLPSLTKRDAAQPDMTEFFDFGGAPWATPPTPPAQPTDISKCHFTLP